MQDNVQAQTVFLTRYQHTSVYAEALVVYHVLFQWDENILFFCWFYLGFVFKEQECSVLLSRFWYKYVFLCIVLINIIMLLVQCSSKEADFANTQEMVSINLLYCHCIFLSITLLIPFLFNPLSFNKNKKTWNSSDVVTGKSHCLSHFTSTSWLCMHVCLCMLKRVHKQHIVKTEQNYKDFAPLHLNCEASSGIRH